MVAVAGIIIICNLKPYRFFFCKWTNMEWPGYEANIDLTLFPDPIKIKERAWYTLLAHAPEKSGVLDSIVHITVQ